jgi:hypothetical protein
MKNTIQDPLPPSPQSLLAHGKAQQHQKFQQTDNLDQRHLLSRQIMRLRELKEFPQRYDTFRAEI